ncbi:gonadal somatic cell derived factor isoform X2 [Puntigrus tetrazona]|uniref:gonadal somatic cell derived factor isoform X2 n=1 Tax=Puntigrus tetrazona TaxID=1606681 RepID=UPI001C890B92|nr:gonadal somatic cell derived factor isoform X2 [Puntigrus tetrazona]
MRLLLCVVAVLFGSPLGETFVVLHPSHEASAVKVYRCKGELEIRKILLESLNLQQEPHVSMSVSKMHHLREQWKDRFRSSLPSSPGNSTFLQDSGNSSCCKQFCQVFIKDLGWEQWVVYPESITFVQCRSCSSESADAPEQCCKPKAHDIVPILYMDNWSSLVLSSLSLIRECACDPGQHTQDPEVMMPF